MSKERIDSLFQQKLADHKTPPPAALWDALEEQLGEEESSKKGLILWYRVAAAVILLIVAGWMAVRYTGNTEYPGMADSGEEEEVQNRGLALSGEEEEVQNLAFSGEEEEVQNLALAQSGEEEEVQNRIAAQPEALPLTLEPVPSTTVLAAASGEEEEVQNRAVALLPINALEAQLPTGKVIMARAEVTPVELQPLPEGLLLEGDFDDSLNRAVALAQEVKEGDITLADLRDAKDELGEQNPLSLASIRDAKDEFLTFNWIND